LKKAMKLYFANIVFCKSYCLCLILFRAIC